MKKLPVLAFIGVTALTACTGDLPAGNVPAQSTGAPLEVNRGEVETPNSLPNGFTTQNSMASQSGVVGVTHLPP